MRLRTLILQKIAELGEGTLESFFPAKYPEARMWRDLLGTTPSYRFSKPTFSAILSQLRKEGFVERKNSSRKKSLWHITAKGKNSLHHEKAGGRNDGITRIIAFDIPEKEKKKRRWIREELIGLGYRQLQKSVWIGLAPLPEDFFDDLDLMSLRKHIHVFTVEAKGTLPRENSHH